MAIDTNELLAETRLHYLVSDRLPTKREINRVRRLGGKLIHLGPKQLVELYDSWQEHHRELKDEPFVGNLVRNTINLRTESDEILDIAELSLELGWNPGGIPDRELLSVAEEEAIYIGVNPELSADSISAQKLGSLVCSVTIEHPEDERKLYEEARFYIKGDPEDPQFMMEVYERYKEWRDEMLAEDTAASGEEDVDSYLNDLEDERQTQKIITEMGADQFRAVTKKYHSETFYQDKFDEAIETSTTLHAAKQLETEVQEFGFDITQN